MSYNIIHTKDIYSIINIIDNIKLEGIIEISGSNIMWSGYSIVPEYPIIGHFIYNKINEDEFIDIVEPDEELKILIRNHILNTINEVKIQLNIV